MLLDLEKNGMDAVRKYSKQFDDWSPASFELSAAEISRATASLDQQVVDDTAFCQGNVRAFARGAARHAHAARNGNPPGRHPRAQAHPGEPRRQLHPRRAIPDVWLGADEHHPGEGRGRENGRRVHAAREGRRLLPRDDPRDARRGRRSPVHPRRRAGDGDDGVRPRRHRSRSTCSAARATNSSPKPSGSSSADAGSICSPARRRSRSSPTTPPTPRSSPATCSARPSTTPPAASTSSA